MKKIISMILIAALALSLCACGAGTAEKPVKLGSAMDFNRWFGESKKLSKMTGQTVYFQLTGDIAIGKVGILNGGNAAIIDLNGHSITGEENRAFLIADGQLTLRGGTVQTAGSAENGGVIAVTGQSSLTAVDVTLSNTKDSGATGVALGGVLYADGTSQIRLQGDCVINGSPSGLRRSGGAIALSGESCLYMESGTVKNGKAGTAGNIYVDGKAQAYLLGGSVEGGAAVRNSEITGYGGNIYVQGLGAVYVAGSSIKGGTADKDGGNIYLANTGGEAAGLHLLSGSVEGGAAKYDGGNLYAMDKFSAIRIYGGTVSGGDGERGGNVYLRSAPMQVHGGIMTGLAGSETIINGGNISGENATFAMYGGTITSGMAAEYGGNIYLSDSQVDIYGGTISAGAVVAADVTKGGGNLYVGRESTVRLYGGEIYGGISNCRQDQENSAAGANVMIAGTTKMEMFGGTVKDGMVYGSITRGGGVYVYGQAKRSQTEFHFYGGVIENGLLDNKMRGLCIGSYSETKGDSGRGIARVFGGELRYTGDPENKNKVYTLHGNKTEGIDLYLFDPANYEGMYSRTTAGPCVDPTHNTQTGEVAATCLTHGCTQYTCDTCGIWYVITAEPTGHTEATEDTQLGVKHSCSACQLSWYTEE